MRPSASGRCTAQPRPSHPTQTSRLECRCCQLVRRRPDPSPNCCYSRRTPRSAVVCSRRSEVISQKGTTTVTSAPPRASTSHLAAATFLRGRKEKELWVDVICVGQQVQFQSSDFFLSLDYSRTVAAANVSVTTGHPSSADS